MAVPDSFTLTEIARRLEVPQHRLIHLCEKGVVVPDVHDAAGRGSSRLFSANNLLELAVALRLRDLMLPVSIIGAIVHVLRRFEEKVQARRQDLSLAESLRVAGSPDLRVIVSDGHTLYFSLGSPGLPPKLFGGIPLERVAGKARAWDGKIESLRIRRSRNGADGFGGPEHSQFARLELSVTGVAKALPLD